MRKITLFIIILLTGFSFQSFSVNLKKTSNNIAVSIASSLQKQQESNSTVVINKQLLKGFFKKYVNLQPYEAKVSSLYANRKFHSIWFDTDCQLVPLAPLLYAKTNSLTEEAVESCIDYQNIIDGIFDSNSASPLLSYDETEIMLSVLYVYYVQNVFDDFDRIQLQKMGWFLQGKELNYNEFLDALLKNPKLLDYTEKYQFAQYYKLRSALKKYREIEKNGEWNTIEYDSTIQNYKPYDSCKTISQIRHRLYIFGYLKEDSKSELYDHDLMNAVLHYKKRMGYYPNYFITPQQIKQLNLPIQDYIQKIALNMERCRWVDPELTNSCEYLMVNIPAFELYYIKNAQEILRSKVVVGQDIMQTVIFSRCVNAIVFSPYWYVPKSIIENEIMAAMKKDKNYLEAHEMEWNNGNIRQKPGPKNAMGLVKFVFPNPEDIYLHDTPSKMLFGLEYRAYSHGCINLEKSQELAHLILKDNPDWPAACVDEAMQGDTEIYYPLANEIPIHIGYFTAWVDDYGVLHFYDDVYSKDAPLKALLFQD
ncbi:hypothetical protein B6A10_00635 [Flavobacterium sp. L1I52]|uniref:L,D-TPase catalytic domain-containing protein n=1 Tax=Flavobacterium pokkalii TaxID=1940408 RepID=A0ABR7UNA2_9FLAO|nr:L,D-transpeptidase family protein [Flavobacterium pokkalii]MBD0723678.1 hypothetical protein [Flavobacterium pokkalii]